MATDNVTPMEQSPEKVKAANPKPAVMDAEPSTPAESARVEEVEPADEAIDADPTTPYRDALHGWMLSAQAVMGAAQAIGVETIAFWHSRTKAGLETAGRLAQCTSPQTLAEIQMDHARTTIQAYADQIAKIGEIGGRLVREGCAPIGASAGPAAAAPPTELAA